MCERPSERSGDRNGVDWTLIKRDKNGEQSISMEMGLKSQSQRTW